LARLKWAQSAVAVGRNAYRSGLCGVLWAQCQGGACPSFSFVGSSTSPEPWNECSNCRDAWFWCELDKEQVAELLARQALTNITDVLSWDEKGVTVKPSAMLDGAVLPAIAEVCVVDGEIRTN